MKLRVTKRDIIALGVAVPVALTVIYLMQVRAPVARHVAALEDRILELGDEDSLMAERPLLQRKRAEAQAVLASLADIPEESGTGETVAMPNEIQRLRGIIATLSEAGDLKITATERLEGDVASANMRLLQEAGDLKEPAYWRILFNADYPAAVRAFARLAERHPAAIVANAGFGKSVVGVKSWTIEVWL